MYMAEVNGQTEEVLHNVPHVKQKHEWDCGLACVAMTVSSEITNFNLEKVMWKLKNEPNEGFGQRPWTIDLCRILSELNVPYKYFTLYNEVNPNLSKLSYYTASFKKDENRVSTFLSSPKLLPNIYKMSLNNDSLITNLKNGPLIVLVSGNKLDCIRCQQNISKCFKLFWRWITSWKFVGHYIVVIGYSPKNNLIYYRNPSLKNQICITTFQTFNEARLAIGTDEDIILVERLLPEMSTVYVQK